MKKWFLASSLFLLSGISAWAQDGSTEAASGLRADGKIWVVMAVCVTILGGVLFYLWRIDRKVSELEKK
jgi:hypothetical protein